MLLLAAAAAALGAVWFSGAALPLALGDPGAFVRWGTPVVSALRNLVAAGAVGCLVLAVGVLPRRLPVPRKASADDGAPRPGAQTEPTGQGEQPERPGEGAPPARTSRRDLSARQTVDADGRAYPTALLLAGGFAVAWTLVNALHLVLTYARAGRVPLDDPTFGDQLLSFVTEVTLGRSLLATTIIAACVAVLALAVATPTGAAWTLVLAVSAFAFQSATGHASQNSSHELALSSLFLHLLGAGVWIGALLGLALLAGRLGRDAAPAVRRFSVLAGWCLVAVGVSGLVSAALRVGSLDDLGSRYGLLVLVKVVLLGVLGGIGLAHRLAVVRRLEGAPSGRAVRAGIDGSPSGTGVLVGSTGADDGEAPAAVSPGPGRVRMLLWRLVVVELAVMGAVSGVASALASTPTPVPDEPPSAPTPAQIVTGHLLPPELTFEQWFVQWRWDVLIAFGCAAALFVYLRWVVRLRRRGDAWPVGRTVSWVIGVVVLVWTGNGGPAMYGHILFSAHMVQHMVLAMVIPMFLVLGAPVTLAMRALPARHDGSRGPREWILTIVHSRYGQFFANPVVAAVNFAGSMIVFYYSPAFEIALRTYAGHLAMTAHFLLAGYFFANALIGIDPGPRRIGYPQRLLVLFATMAFHAFFGVALMSGDLLLVPDWFGLLGREWGPSAIVDQQRGGALAWGIGEIPVLVLAVLVAVAWTRDDERTARRRDRKVERDGDVEMDEYNAMLERLGRGER